MSDTDLDLLDMEMFPLFEVTATVTVKRSYFAEDHAECKEKLFADLVREGWVGVEIKHIKSRKK